MKKELINVYFPGQETKIVTVYIKVNEEEAFSQLRLPLEDLDDSLLNSS